MTSRAGSAGGPKPGRASFCGELGGATNNLNSRGDLNRYEVVFYAGLMQVARILSIAIGLISTAGLVRAGITYKLRVETAKGKVANYTVWADGQASRTEITPYENMPELERQYPIVLSTNGGKTLLYLRPENHTWYERSDKTRPLQDIAAVGTNARLLEHNVTVTEEVSGEKIAGLATRQVVVRASWVIESEIDTEKVKLHKTRTILIWVADFSCAPKTSREAPRFKFGVPELDGAIRAKLDSVEGLIVRVADSTTERYEGGAVRAFVSQSEVNEPRCSELRPSLFAIPKDYRYQQPVIGAPGA